MTAMRVVILGRTPEDGAELARGLEQALPHEGLEAFVHVAAGTEDLLGTDRVLLLAGADDRLHGQLVSARHSFAVLHEPERFLGDALAAARRWLSPPRPTAWRWVCADCDDADCERHARSLLAGEPSGPALP